MVTAVGAAIEHAGKMYLSFHESGIPATALEKGVTYVSEDNTTFGQLTIEGTAPTRCGKCGWSRNL